MPFIESGLACGENYAADWAFVCWIRLRRFAASRGLEFGFPTYRADDKGVIADGGRDGLSHCGEEGMSCDQMRTCCIE
jgi:hypothetical protein